MPDDAITDDHSAQPIGLPRHNPGDAAAARQLVEVLATEFIQECREGHTPSIDDYAQRFPARADEIRRLFPLVAAMEGWKSEKATPPRPTVMPSDFPVDRLGDCRIIGEVGRGGMGVVFEAYQDPPGRRVAVKLLPWQHGPDSPWREQFAHEARLAAGLRHANIVSVYQYGEQAGFSYYVMPFIVGVGLDWIIERLREDDGVIYAEEIRRFRERGEQGNHRQPAPAAADARQRSPVTPAPMDVTGVRPDGEGRQLSRHSWRKIAKIGAQVAAALRYAHRQGLLHRDIKPGNILLDADGVVWITDFGLARQISGVDDSPDIAGTLRYMSPEHLVGSADERSDLYSLGITLLELCTLRPAFDVRTKSELKQAIRSGDLVPPRTVTPDLPSDLEAIILKAAAADPHRRYQSADELTTDLLRYLNGGRVSAARRSWFRRRRK